MNNAIGNVMVHSTVLPADAIQLGTLGKTFGLHGGLYFYPMGMAEQACLATLPQVYVQVAASSPTANAVCFTVQNFKPHGKKHLVFFKGLTAVEHVRSYVNALVYVDATVAARALQVSATQAGDTEDLVYIDALLNLPVYVDGEHFGTVVDIRPGAAQDLLYIETPQGSRHMLPLQADYVFLDDVSLDDGNTYNTEDTPKYTTENTIENTVDKRSSTQVAHGKTVKAICVENPPEGLFDL